MQSVSPFGITWRVSLITTVLVFLGFAILGTSIFITSKSQIGDRLEQESRDFLQVATTSLTQPVWVFDFKALDQITNALVNQEQRTMMAIRVLSRDSKVLSEKLNPRNLSMTFEDLAKNASYRFIERPLIFENQEIGKVQVLFSDEYLNQDLYNLIKSMTLLTAWMAFFFSGVVFWITRRLLIAPLNRLVRVASNIEQGDYSVPTENWEHEFLILSRAFASATEAIQKRDQELKMHAENLERQVEARTRELDIQRMNTIQSSRLAALGEISAGIAHEINNPLAIIQGNSELLSTFLKDNDPARLHLERISAMVVRIAKIVKGLRTFARDGSKDPMTQFKVSPFLDDLKNLCMARLKSQNIQLTVHCTRGLEAHGREVPISQVLLNLINNSIDALEQISDDKWITLEAFERNNNVVFSITDSGRGIPPNIREKIMQPFFTTKVVGKGTGLGLAISVGIARDHGGDVVYVADCENTRFEVVLPKKISHLRVA